MNSRSKVNRMKLALYSKFDNIYIIKPSTKTGGKNIVPSPMNMNNLLLNYYDLNGEITYFVR